MAPVLTNKQLDEFRKKEGDEIADGYKQLMNTVDASWECRDCILLPTDENYFKKLEARWKSACHRSEDITRKI